MYYTVYKITNNIDGKIYIGCHKTDNLDDGYMGSGKYLRRAIEKHGIENFAKEYIQVFDNTDDMFSMESELVNEEFVKRTDTYNLKEGGHGGWEHLNDGDCKDKNPRFSSERQREISPFHKEGEDKLLRKKWAKKGGSITKQKGIGIFDPDNKYDWTGKRHKEESKRKIGEANSKHQTGKGNSNYGKCWIHHPELKQSKPVPRFELPQWEDKGWIKGRKIKW